VDGNLFVPPDAEGTDGVAGLAVHGSLTGQLLEHLCGSGETITALADGDVEHQFLDAELPHGVGGFGLGLSSHQYYWIGEGTSIGAALPL